jgi:chemotaxis receptor (MCP) glutamine deamidase CheD
MPENRFLLPGEMAWQREPALLTTLLGSCVAVCLIDAQRGSAGMNHFMVPDARTAGGMPPGKVGESAIDGLIQLARMAGSAPADLVAEIHGGGAVVGPLGGGSGLLDVGMRNIACARARLAHHGIRVRAEDVGGGEARRICLDTAAGRIEARRIPRAADPAPAGGAAGRTARVLVVDDSPVVRQLLGKAISASGDLVVDGEAGDPFEARERILERAPDVLCLDLIMPNLDGLSFLRRIMQFKPIPTVVVSTIAKAGSAMREKVMAAGAHAAIDKEDLGLYQGGDACQRLLIPALRAAARSRPAIPGAPAGPGVG